MTYVLILWIFGHSVATAEFRDKATCEGAGTAFQERYAPKAPYYVGFICAPKGEPKSWP